MRETHTAVVVLVGDRAYKVKKPVDLGFLDFSSPRARQQACRREVELNRRLAPDVYLGTATLTGPGDVEEPLVVMRRMPDDRRLSTLVLEHRVGEDEVRRIARAVAVFHAGARRSPRIAHEGGAEALRQRWTDSFDQVRPFHGSVLDGDLCAEAERLVDRYLGGREQAFADRVAAGRVVDGHGDLLADDIFCLPDGPRILDCLEFDDRLRYVDEVDDAAFLAMDLEHLGATDLARSFVDSYLEYSGDPAPGSLIEHYVAYRAFVRAKVACLRHAQGDDEARATARDLTGLTLAHLQQGAVRLLLVGGLPGTGKSTLSGLLADQLGLVLLSSDRVRKETAGLSPETPAAAGYREGLYSPDRTEETYRELLTRARSALVRGESVVLDASWTQASHRRAAQQLAERTCTDLVALVCRAPSSTAAARLARRSGPSDADATVAAAMAAHADPWPEATAVDTTGPPGAALAQVLTRSGRDLGTRRTQR